MTRGLQKVPSWSHIGPPSDAARQQLLRLDSEDQDNNANDDQDSSAICRHCRKKPHQQGANADKRAAANAPPKSQLKAMVDGNKFKCPKCMLMIANYKLIVQHMEAKHPKEPVPSEEAFKV
ncbi:hypothetical protein BGZ67_007888 [Mortierella alpina]|nr:hypothetical protein BGZ67_007888 [Mortierella alpina]